MVYTYDEKSKKAVAVEAPKITGDDARRMKKAAVAVETIKKATAIRFKVTNA